MFAIEAMGTRVAEVALAREGPRVILAEHLAGDAPILLHRVSDLDAGVGGVRRTRAASRCASRAAARPVRTLRSPGGQRLGLYQLARPEVDEHFAGRADFG